MYDLAPTYAFLGEKEKVLDYLKTFKEHPNLFAST